jgi:Transposase protein
MARGLFSKWKSPIFLGFDTNVTKALLQDLIVSLHQVNYDVVGCVSDMGTSNQGLWKELDVSMYKTNFNHPVTNNQIQMFADVPHLLKLTRNWLFDSGKTLLFLCGCACL